MRKPANSTPYIKYKRSCAHDPNGLNTLLWEKATSWRDSGTDLKLDPCDLLGLSLAVMPDQMISQQETVYKGDIKPLVVHPLLEEKSMVSKLEKFAHGAGSCCSLMC